MHRMYGSNHHGYEELKAVNKVSEKIGWSRMIWEIDVDHDWSVRHGTGGELQRLKLCEVVVGFEKK